MVRAGEIGEVRQVHLTYVQGHNASLVEDEPGGKAWRFDPTQAGASLILGDIGSHAHHLGAYVTGLELQAVMAEVAATVPGRTADDYAGLLLRWSGGVPGTMWVTTPPPGRSTGCVPRLRQPRRARVAPGAPERAAPPPARRLRAGADQAAARRAPPRRGARGPRRDRPPRGLPGGLRHPLPRRRRGDRRPPHREQRRTRWRSTSRPSRTGRAASGSSRPASRAPGRGAGSTAGWSCEAVSDAQRRPSSRSSSHHPASPSRNRLSRKNSFGAW